MICSQISGTKTTYLFICSLVLILESRSFHDLQVLCSFSLRGYWVLIRIGFLRFRLIDVKIIAVPMLIEVKGRDAVRYHE